MAEVKKLWFLQPQQGSNAPPAEGKDPLDEIIDRNKKNKATEAKSAEVDAIIADAHRRTAEAEAAARKARGETTSEEVERVSVTAATSAMIIGSLVSAGYDADKANAFIKGLDNETLARLAMLSGRGGGVDAMMPLFMYGRQQGTGVTELVALTKPYVDLVEKQLEKQGGKTSELTDFANAVNALRPPTDQNSELMQAVLARMEKSDEKFEKLLESMHKSELDHQRDLSEMKLQHASESTEAMRREISGLSVKLENANKFDISGEIKKARATLEELGLKVSVPGKESGMEDAAKMADTILRTPAIENLSRSLGQNLANSAARGPRNSNGTMCQVCLGKGVRTPLNVTPEVMQGKATVTCPTCGTVYGKAMPGQPQGVA